jgi:hypothetical protein
MTIPSGMPSYGVTTSYDNDGTNTSGPMINEDDNLEPPPIPGRYASAPAPATAPATATASTPSSNNAWSNPTNNHNSAVLPSYFAPEPTMIIEPPVLMETTSVASTPSSMTTTGTEYRWRQRRRDSDSSANNNSDEEDSEDEELVPGAFAFRDREERRHKGQLTPPPSMNETDGVDMKTNKEATVLGRSEMTETIVSAVKVENDEDAEQQVRQRIISMAVQAQVVNNHVGKRLFLIALLGALLIAGLVVGLSLGLTRTHDDSSSGLEIETPRPPNTLDTVKERGLLRCGYFVYHGWGQADPETGEVHGFNPDLVRTLDRPVIWIATAIHMLISTFSCEVSRHLCCCL